MQTSNPIWLKEAYANAITNLDIGLASRNIYLVEEVSKLIEKHFTDSKIMLDFAGGYGLFVRLMRDKGYNFYRQDDYCDNIFANYFDINNIKEKKFDVATAFEVFEHFPNPLVGIERLFDFSNTIIFSTELTDNAENLEDWWYISEETGQHIAFYSKKTLEFIAKKHSTNFYTNNYNLHLFTKKSISQNEIFETEKYISRKKRIMNILLGKDESKNKANKTSLLQQDYHYIKSMLHKK